MNDQIIMKDIPGYEGKYMATTDGRIWSVKNKRFKKLFTCQQQYGYKKIFVSLTHNGIQPVSRLIALTFIPNPENKPQVDHINRDPTDNRVSNLRWVTRKENVENSNYMNGIKAMAQLHSKPIACCEAKDTNNILWVFKSTCQAAKMLFDDWNKNSLISRCAKGKKNTAYGFHWKYIDMKPFQNFDENKKKEILNSISAQ